MKYQPGIKTAHLISVLFAAIAVLSILISPALGLTYPSGTQHVLHFNSTDGTGLGIDDTNSTYPWTVGSHAIYSNATKKFGVSSVYLNASGTTSYIESPIGTSSLPGDFTVEGWFYFPTGAPGGFLFDVDDPDGLSVGAIATVFSSGTLDARRRTTVYGTTGNVIPLNTWNHVAITRKGSICNIWVNGTNSFNFTESSSTVFNAKTYIGSRYNGDTPAQQYVDDFIISTYSKYSSNFTVPQVEEGTAYNFVANRTYGVTPLTIKFINEDSPPYPDFSLWDFGDSTTINTTDYTIDHTYTLSGNYTVTRNASVGGVFKNTTRIDYIIAGYTIPVSSFSASDTWCVAPCTITFSDLTANSPTAWFWEFGDYNTSALKNPTWTYDVSGYKNVNLTSYNPAGSDSENKTSYIYVAPPGSPDIDFIGSPTIGAPSLLVAFTDLTQNSPTSWNWSFGDGQFSTEQNPKHVYAYAGIYTVSLTVNNGVGTESLSKSNYITVSTSSDTVWYSPYQIQLKIVDTYGVPLANAYISISYISSSLPNTDISWMTAHYGISSTVAEQMTNSSLFEQDYTGADGTMTFTGFSSIRYNVSITNASIGLDHSVTIMPKDNMYVIYCPLPGQTPGTDTLTARQNVTLPWYKINSTAYKFELRYQDTTACTTGLVFNVSYQNGTAIYNEDLGNPGTSFMITNHTMISPGLGYEVLWKYNATRTC